MDGEYLARQIPCVDGQQGAANLCETRCGSGFCEKRCYVLEEWREVYSMEETGLEVGLGFFIDNYPDVRHEYS